MYPSGVYITQIQKPPRLVQTKKAFGSELYIPQRGTWGGSLIFMLKKSVFTEHPSPRPRGVFPFLLKA